MLWAGDNRLQEVPVTVGKLTRLVSLRLDKNLLQTLPVEVGMCLLIQDLNVLNNPHLYQPPPETLVRGTPGLLAHMQRLLQASSRHSHQQTDVLEVSQEELEGELMQEDDEEDEGDEYDEDGQRKEKKKKPTVTELFAAGMTMDAEGVAIPHQVNVSRDASVKYLNQPCKILSVYSEAGKVFCDMQHVETGQMFVRIKHDMVSG